MSFADVVKNAQARTGGHRQAVRGPSALSQVAQDEVTNEGSFQLPVVEQGQCRVIHTFAIGIFSTL